MVWDRKDKNIKLTNQLHIIFQEYADLSQTKNKEETICEFLLLLFSLPVALPTNPQNLSIIIKQ